MEELICNCLLCLNPLKGPIIKMMDGERTGSHSSSTTYFVERNQGQSVRWLIRNQSKGQRQVALSCLLSCRLPPDVLCFTWSWLQNPFCSFSTLFWCVHYRHIFYLWSLHESLFVRVLSLISNGNLTHRA